MATVNLRKRKHNDLDGAVVDGAVVPSSSSRAHSDYLDDANSLQRPASPGLHGMLGDGAQTYTHSSVSGEGRAHFGNVYNVTNSGSTTAREEQYERFRESLAFQRMDFRLSAIDGAYVETCQWIFDDDHFSRWLNPSLRDSHHNLFWIKGNPGSGKSTLMKCIYERLTQYLPGCKIISFFFNARGDVLERSTEGCYRSMIHQMLEHFAMLRTALRIPDVADKGQIWPVAVLQGIFRESVLLVQRQHLVLMVDALDECEQPEVRDMVYFLESLSQSAQNQGIALSICFASRHYPSVTVRFCEEMTLESRDAHTKDIKHYIWSNLNVELEKPRRALMDLLLGKSQGVFLWVVLVLRRVNEQADQCATFNELVATIDALPAQLDTLIGNIISEGMLDDCLLPALLWTLVGRHMTIPLDVARLCFAIRFCAKKHCSPLRSQDEFTFDVKQMRKFIVYASKGLVESMETEDRPRIWSCQFIHESVRQHILRGGLATLHASLTSNVEAASHALLAEWCQEYLRSDPSNCIDFKLDPPWNETTFEEHADIPAKCQLHKAFPLLQYVELRTFSHLNAAYRGGLLGLNDLYAFPVREWVSIVNRNRKFNNLEPTASLLHIMLDHAVACGTLGIMEDLLERNPLCSNPQKNEVTKSSHQCYCGLVFGKGAEDPCVGSLGGPALTIAIARGSSSLAQLIFDHGGDFNIDAIGGEYCTALIAASVHGEVNLVRRMLTRGTDVRPKSDKYGTALDAARAFGHQEVARMLSEAALG